MPLVLTPIRAGTQLTGRVVGSGWTDEFQDWRYLLVEGTDGHLHYVPRVPAPGRAGDVPRLRIGERVTLTGRAIEREGRGTVQVDLRREGATSGPPARTAEPPGRGSEPATLPLLASLQRMLGRPIHVIPPLDGHQPGAPRGLRPRA